MHVIFVEPGFPANQREFVRALYEVGARVTGIGEAPAEYLGDQLRHWLYGYEQVPSVVHEESMYNAVRRIQGREWVDRLETTVEAHISPAAEIRKRCTIPGTSVETAFLCRDKPAMKEALRKAGIPCAQSIGSSSREEIEDFAKRVGYPLILKPRAGAGASGTHRVDNDEQLGNIMDIMGIGHGGSVAVEEFIEGHEGFYDSITINGRIVHDFASHYFPGVLEAMRTRWISPQFIATNRIDSAPDYKEVKAMGQKVVEALGIETSATHMEWFFGPKGLKFSEIGCRPPGVGAWDLYRAGNDMDIYREWAHAIVHQSPSAAPSRRFSAGIINLRPDRDGHIVGYEGLDQVMNELESMIIDSHIPPQGTPTQSVEAGYMANAWIRLRHPDYDELRRIMNLIGERVQVRAA